MPRTLFHSGYMKTGSTLLQSEIFSKVDDCELYSYASGFAHLADSLRHAPDPEAMADIAAKIRQWITRSDKDLQLFSWEGLIGDYLSDYQQFETMTNLIELIDPEAHILLVIRNQGDLCNSLYKQALHRGHWVSPKQFVNFGAGGLGDFRRRSYANMDVRSLNFDAAVRKYENIFGTNRVHVLVYEWLSTDPARFFEALSRSLERQVIAAAQTKQLNVGYNRPISQLARLANRLFRTEHNPSGLLPYRPFDEALRLNTAPLWQRKLMLILNALFDPRLLLQSRWVAKIPGSGDLLGDPIRQNIHALTADSNRALDQRRNLGLSELGYY